MKSFHFLFLVLLTYFSSMNLYAQDIPDPKLARSFNKAVESYRRGDNMMAMRHLNAIIEEDSTVKDAWLLMGDLYMDGGEPMKAISSYEKAISIDSSYYPPAYYILANLQFDQEIFDKAKRNYLAYLEFLPKSTLEIRKCQVNIPLCDLRAKLMSDPVPFQPQNLGPNVNTGGYEYVNSLSLDNSLIYFTRKAEGPKADESFFYSRRYDQNWSPSLEIGEPINTPGNEGALCLSPDGMFIFLTCCSRPDSYGGCDIYRSQRMGSAWTEPENLGGEVNSTSWDTQPCMSSDGRTLYFVSARRGGVGGSDIWKSVLQPSGYWGIPENLGDTINTPEDEMAPFIHPDGRTLYFSSKGHPGMGGSDLFVSRLDVQNHWSVPENIGYPVNTKGDEINLVIDATGTYAYISSDKAGGKGATDIYRFELPPKARPEPVSYVKGLVFDKNDSHPLSAAFELIDLQAGMTIVTSISDPVKGDFILSLPVGKDYALNVSCKGYLFYSANFNLSNGHGSTDPFMLSIPMQPVNVGEKVVLRNIFFDTDKFELKPESVVELNKLHDFLVKNPAISIEISGHTDNLGAEEHNLELSNNRARSVYNYLLNSGIDKGRLSFRGYGEGHPLDTNDTEEGRANNRRTEFKVIAKY